MVRKSIPQKTKALLQKEIHSACPFCESIDVDHFQIHHIDENPENNKFDNLIMLCPICHSKITKNDISKSQVENVKQKLATEAIEGKKVGAKIINFNSHVKNAVVGDNNNVTINNVKKTNTNKYPQGCIGHDIQKANYIGYLITRYHEYKEWEVGKEKMNYAIFQSSIKKKYKMGKTRSLYHIPIEKFDELAEFIQFRIDGTVLANVKKSKEQYKNYSLFEEYCSGVK